MDRAWAGMERDLSAVTLQRHVRANRVRRWPGFRIHRERAAAAAAAARVRDPFDDIRMEAINCTTPEEVQHFMTKIHHKGALDDGGLERNQNQTFSVPFLMGFLWA